jgi:hypothetical protein
MFKRLSKNVEEKSSEIIAQLLKRKTEEKPPSKIVMLFESEKINLNEYKDRQGRTYFGAFAERIFEKCKEKHFDLDSICEIVKYASNNDMNLLNLDAESSNKQTTYKKMLHTLAKNHQWQACAAIHLMAGVVGNTGYKQVDETLSKYTNQFTPGYPLRRLSS